MGVREELEEIVADGDVQGVLTHYLVVMSVSDVDGFERIIQVASDGTGMATHLGLASAAKLTAESRFYGGDERELDDKEEAADDE